MFNASKLFTVLRRCKDINAKREVLCYVVAVVALQKKEKPKIFEDRFWSIEYPQGLRKGEKILLNSFQHNKKRK